MKKVFLGLTCIAMLLIMAGCKKESNGLLLNDIIPEQEKRVTLYEYQKENSIVYSLSDQELAEELLQELDRIKAEPAEEWTSDLVSLPIYSLVIWQEGDPEDYRAHLVYGYWSNGYWIEPDGNAYKYKWNTEELKKEFFDKEELRKYSNIASTGTIRMLVTDESGWKKDFLTEAEPAKTMPELITNAIMEDDKLVVFVKNQGDSLYLGNKYTFAIEVYLDDTWYDIPRDEWEIYHRGDVPGVGPGEEGEISYSLRMYKDLPAGTYRLVTGSGEDRENLVEFVLP
ncbi:MAG: hypothetical protein IKT67_07660 [Lachnospiraceae bacterium]|nr:hypothetical protein [Lachnospiraceae bacterium]